MKNLPILRSPSETNQANQKEIDREIVALGRLHATTHELKLIKKGYPLEVIIPHLVKKGRGKDADLVSENTSIEGNEISSQWSIKPEDEKRKQKIREMSEQEREEYRKKREKKEEGFFVQWSGCQHYLNLCTLEYAELLLPEFRAFILTHSWPRFRLLADVLQRKIMPDVTIEEWLDFNCLVPIEEAIFDSKWQTLINTGVDNFASEDIKNAYQALLIKRSIAEEDAKSIGHKMKAMGLGAAKLEEEKQAIASDGNLTLTQKIELERKHIDIMKDKKELIKEALDEANEKTIQKVREHEQRIQQQIKQRQEEQRRIKEASNE
ncbi:MAG: hypothetical protein AUF65_01490 [Chloroflexi bacterium 13_1_20CM_50_12]|nr:MAG: hypothetical protein AUF65_01490 [Chloroflexi bacterium 13_1_20CM_50_12]